MTQDYYRVGEKLRITIEGDAIDIGAMRGDTLLTLSYLLPEVAAAHVGVFTDSPAITVTRVTPVEGEPQRGDIWRGRSGADWFAFGSRYGSVYLMSKDGSGEPWETVNQEDGPLFRIYRKQGEQPAEQVPTRPQVGLADVGTPSEDTVPIGGCAPGSYVSHPDWNDGEPVLINHIQDSNLDPGKTYLLYLETHSSRNEPVEALVDPDMQVTPWTPADGA